MDNYKRVEQLLYNYRIYQVSIINKTEEIEMIAENNGVSGINYEQQSCDTNKISSIVENTVISKIQRIEKLEGEIETLRRKIEKIDRTLAALSQQEREVLKSKYIEGKQWYEVSGRVYLSERQCRNIRTDAIKKMVIGIYGSSK